jgi:hypothetical protein
MFTWNLKSADLENAVLGEFGRHVGAPVTLWFFFQIFTPLFRADFWRTGRR